MAEHDPGGQEPPGRSGAPWNRPQEPSPQEQWSSPSGPYRQQPGWGLPVPSPGGTPDGSTLQPPGPYHKGTPWPPGFGQPRYVAPPKPGIIPLRPLMFGEILDGSFQAIRRNAKAMLGAAVLAQSLAAIFTAVVTVASASPAGLLEDWARNASSADAASLGIGFMAAVLLLLVLTLFISTVLQGAMVVPVARSVLDRPTGFRRMWALTRPQAGALLRLAALLLAAGTVALLVPAVAAVVVAATADGLGILVLIPLFLFFAALYSWIYVRLLVAPAAVVIEELGALDGLRRSWSLTRDNWWRILGIALVVGLIVSVISQVVTIPITLLAAFLPGVVSPHAGSGEAAAVAVAIGVATAVVTALVAALGYAFQTSAMALIYMDLRMRKDGLDISLLQQLETGADPDGVPGRGLQGQRMGQAPGTGPGTGAWPDVH